MNPKKLEENIIPAFIKRLLKFYYPKDGQFVLMDYDLDNMIYAWVGYLLLKSLLKGKSGWDFLYSQSESFNIHLMFGVNLSDSKDNFVAEKGSYAQEII